MWLVLAQLRMIKITILVDLLLHDDRDDDDDDDDDDED